MAPYNWSLLRGNLPAGITLSSGGVLSGTPALVAVFEFSVTVSDSRQMWDSRILYLRVEAQPPLAVASGPASLARMVQGQPYNQTLAAIGGTPPYTWSISAGTLPDGITLSLGGVLSGTPTVLSEFNFTLQVTDSTSGTPQTAMKSIKVVVWQIAITTASPLPDTSTTQPYSQTLTAIGGKPPYSWSISDGDDPNGLTLSPDGVLSGTPNFPGGFGFTVRVQDSTTPTPLTEIKFLTAKPAP